jgi:hypothetical protein
MKNQQSDPWITYPIRQNQDTDSLQLRLYPLVAPIIYIKKGNKEQQDVDLAILI